MRATRLDTHEGLTEAVGHYESSGYHRISPYGSTPYAHRWFEKPLEGVPSEPDGRTPGRPREEDHVKRTTGRGPREEGHVMSE